MKYWHQLSNVEEAIFQVRKIRSQLSVMMDSELIVSSNNDKFPETYKDFLYDLSERFENAMSTLNVEFQTLWDVIREDTFEENKQTLDDWKKDQADKERWSKIVQGMMPKESKYPDSKDWSIEPLGNGDFMVKDNAMASQPSQNDVLVIKEVDGNLTATYRPATAEDSFDEQWKEAYKRQSDR
jgi:hypothetical protein